MSILDFTYPLSVLLIFSAAVGLGVYLTRKFHLDWQLYFIGAAGFILSQVFHIPFNFLVNPLIHRVVVLEQSSIWFLLVQTVFLGLSAGLFEEVTRYLVYRYWAKDARSWAKGLLLGAGHGGVEAILIGGLILITYFGFVSLKDVDLSTRVPQEQLALAQQQVDAFWGATWYDSLLSTVERLFTLPIQIGLSILVLQVFTRRQARWLWLAVGWHAAVDFLALIILAQTHNFYVTEAAIGVFALVSLGAIFALRQPEPVEPEPAPLPPVRSAQDVQGLLIIETEEKLDNSRYARPL